MPVYSLENERPRISANAFVHPDAVLIGRVILGPETSVWPGAVLRGDVGFIEVGERTSVQDGTVVHTTDQWPTRIGAGCIVGHNAHLEGCVVEDACLVGSMSAVLNRVHIGRGSVVGAGAVVPEDLEAPERSMLLGVPARIRPLPDETQNNWIEGGAKLYVELAHRYSDAMTRVDLDDCRVE